ncbi:SRPBCC family protein [Cellulomonas sp. DKR-3]|uniref:SRPBCC family protein n=1 Tax=Cellulomonas fulva TaxID=2835530 RepID=A0ABS5U3D0_9CELL|nr:SRPBCC family protein [Cellulomonas fulva]MBT0995846.1 SRPBCC family protein [Cellulomonas fulva]
MTGTDLHGLLTRDADGVRVVFRRSYPTTAEDLWAAVTEPERVRRWLGPLYGDLRVGGRYELRMGDDVADSDQNARGEVLECEPPHRLVVTWVFPSERETRVEVRVRPDGALSVLELVHTGLADEAARGYGGGWHACLDQLDDHVAGRAIRPWDVLYAAVQDAYPLP